jgi:hypothetical protein
MAEREKKTREIKQGGEKKNNKKKKENPKWPHVI